FDILTLWLPLRVLALKYSMAPLKSNIAGEKPGLFFEYHVNVVGLTELLQECSEVYAAPELEQHEVNEFLEDRIG
ncbi:hypothetical protein ACJX0J_025432, partial [Zea mays]